MQNEADQYSTGMNMLCTHLQSLSVTSKTHQTVYRGNLSSKPISAAVLTAATDLITR